MEREGFDHHIADGARADQRRVALCRRGVLMATGSPKTKWLTQSDPLLNRVQLPTGVSLSYEGKTPEQEVLATSAGSAFLIWTAHPNAPNQLYYGDNLPLLAALLHDNSIKGQVKLIYIDPPFATNSVFHSRTQADAYQDLLVGAAFLEFMRKRLILLRELLSEDGSIYVHLDENMAFHIKVIMDEVFGVHNFRNWITRRKCSHKNYTKKTYGSISDYILFYTKSDTYVWNRPIEAWTTERSLKEYTNVEESTGRRYKKVPVHAPGTRNGETGQPWRGVSPPPGKHWQYSTLFPSVLSHGTQFVGAIPTGWTTTPPIPCRKATGIAFRIIFRLPFTSALIIRLPSAA